MTEAPIMRLSDFSKVFEVMCNTLGVDIGGVLSQEKHHIAVMPRFPKYAEPESQRESVTYICEEKLHVNMLSLK